MPSKRNMHYARNTLKNKKRHDSLSQLVPTVSVERPIIWDKPEDEQAYLVVCQKAVGMSVKAKHRDKHAIIAPQKVSLIQLNHTLLAEQNVTYHWASARQEVAYRLACLLQDRLDRLLKTAPKELVIGLGNIAVSKPSGRNNDEQISFGLNGWKGQFTKYSQIDSGGHLNPLYQLKEESMLYADALTETYEWFDPKGVVAEPRIPVIGSRSSIAPDMRKLSEFLDEESPMPEIIRLGDPVIMFRNGHDVTIMSSRHEYVSPLAA